MLNLAINLFLFIAILFMVAVVFGFFWVITVIVFMVREVKEVYSEKGSGNDGQPNSKEY